MSLNGSSLFRTFQRVRLADSNNNLSNLDEGDDHAWAFLNDPLENRSAIFESICDNCGNSRPELILRWCDTCSAAVCDACVLDHHVGTHSIFLYQDALRLANKKLGDALHNSRINMKQTAEHRAKTRRFHREIVLKLDDAKRKVKQLATESNEIVGAATQQLDDLTKLNDVVLNAKTTVDRRYADTAARAYLMMQSKRQEAIVEQLKRICGTVTEMYQNVGQGK